jgi:hypothetical protein
MYSATTNLHKSPQHPLRLSPVCCVFTSCSLAMACNNGGSSASHAEVLSSQPLAQNSTELTTDLVTPTVFTDHICTKHRSFSYANRFHGNVFA